MTLSSREQLKRAVVARLDAIAQERTLLHQGAYANRYSMRSDLGAAIELMFEKAPGTPPHLWVLAGHVAAIPDGAIPSRFYSKADLYKVPAKNGKMRYGRHSGLEKMPQLGRADLMRFTLRTVADLDDVLAVLRQVSRRDAVAV